MKVVVVVRGGGEMGQVPSPLSDLVRDTLPGLGGSRQIPIGLKGENQAIVAGGPTTSAPRGHASVRDQLLAAVVSVQAKCGPNIRQVSTSGAAVGGRGTGKPGGRGKQEGWG